MNKSARILLLIVALLVASFVSFGLYQRMQQQPTVIKTESSKGTIQIAVAAKTLSRGAKISVQDLRMVAYLEDTVPQGHFTDLESAVGRIVINSVQPTEPLLESSLAPTSLTKGGMAAIISPQKRAMAVKVNDIIGVAGFLRPGHKVDVLVAMAQPGNKKGQISKTVLENIPVLSVGTMAQESKDEQSPKRVTVVTLEVDLEEAEKLALAVNQGRIQLALRGYTDSDQVLTKGINVAALLKSYATPSKTPVTIRKPPKVTIIKQAPAPAPEPAPIVIPEPVVEVEHVIEVMNGNNVSRLTMGGQ